MSDEVPPERARVLQAWRLLRTELGYDPTVRQLADKLYCVPSTAHHHLRKLRAAGKIPASMPRVDLRRELAAARAEIARLKA